MVVQCCRMVGVSATAGFGSQGSAIAPLLLIASLCIVAGAATAPLLLIASLCIVAGAATAPRRSAYPRSL